jgi:restriction system protein
MEKNYWAIQMGEQGAYAEDAYQNNYISIGWTEVDIDLNDFADLSRYDFFNKIRTLMQKAYPDGGANAVGQYTGQLFRFSNQMKIGDIVVLKQLTEGKITLGVIESDYLYKKIETQSNYNHQRKIKWIKSIEVENISQEFRNTIGSIMTVFNVSTHAEEIDGLIGENKFKDLGTENVQEFGLETHLENFIVKNWNSIGLSGKYKIFENEEGKNGQQYVIEDIGRIDVLAKSHDDKEWLVIELKKGKEDDRVVGQVLKYMGWIQKNEAKNGEKVKGLIITKERNEKLMCALETLEHVSLMTYLVDFKLKEEINN